MAFIAFPQEKKQQILIAALIAVVAVSALIIYFGFFRSPASLPAGEISPPGMTNNAQNGEALKASGEIGDVNFLFLQNPRFLELKKYGEWPIQPRQPGRENPFLPFEGYVADKNKSVNFKEEAIKKGTEEFSAEGLTKEQTEAGENEEKAPEEELEVPVEENDLGKSVEEATIEELLRLLNEDGEKTGTSTGEN